MSTLKSKILAGQKVKHQASLRSKTINYLYSITHNVICKLLFFNSFRMFGDEFFYFNFKRFIYYFIFALGQFSSEIIKITNYDVIFIKRKTI